MQKRKVIAIDGLSATGKSSLSKLLAKEIGFVHLSTGMIYRAVAYLTERENIDYTNPKEIVDKIKDFKLELILKDSSAVMLIDREDVSEFLYTPKISERTSIISAYKEVREFLIIPQREAFPGENIVMEGRDIGTVIFPDADIKFFIEVNLETKVRRRIAQLSLGKELSGEELESLKKDMEIEIVERDKRDAGRSVAPTIIAEDAIVIDNSQDGIEETIKKMVFELKTRKII